MGFQESEKDDETQLHCEQIKKSTLEAFVNSKEINQTKS